MTQTRKAECQSKKPEDKRPFGRRRLEGRKIILKW
jgi:hypothetical protein